MHENFKRADELSHEAIGAAIEVHRELGPGLMESIYEKCFCHELTLRGIAGSSQQSVEISYKNLTFKDALRFDVLIESCLLIELKAIEKVLPIHKAQLMSYMKLLDVPVGLVLNFNHYKIIDDAHRMILKNASN